MYEFLICNIKDYSVMIVYGYSFPDACQRWGVKNPNEWYIDCMEYID